MDLYKSERTKYDVPLNHLDYGYIEKCTNGKELEKIIKVLRSGYEGNYPDLQRLAEEKLETINPQSRVLRVEKPATSKRDLELDEREILDNDMQNWLNQMKNHDQHVGGEVAGPEDDLPPVRGAGTSIPIDMKSAEEAEKAKRRIKPRDPQEWDKVDIEAELAKVDGETKPSRKNVLHDDTSLSSTVKASALSDQEKIMKANREKDKGNEAFRAGDYEEALTYYNRSISVIPTPAAHNNRAQTYLKIEKWKMAYRDCNKVLDMEPNNLKALLRRAVSSQGSKDYVQARNDLMDILHADPNNKKAKQILEEVEQSLSEQKVKGRRMVIKEVEGSDDETDDDDEDDKPVEQKMNGHVEMQPEKMSPETKQEETKSKELTKDVKSNEAILDGGREKDIWSEEDLTPKPQTYTTNIPTHEMSESANVGGTRESKILKSDPGGQMAQEDVQQKVPNMESSADSVKGNPVEIIGSMNSVEETTSKPTETKHIPKTEEKPKKKKVPTATLR